MQSKRVTIPFLLVCFLVIAGTALAEPAFLDRPAVDSVRLLTYNPYWNAIFADGAREFDRSAEYVRILTAVRPDVACIQEVAPGRDRGQIVEIFNAALPLSDGRSWTIASGADNVIVSRYPISWNAGDVVSGLGIRARGNVIAVIDLPGTTGTRDLLVAGAHFTSGGSNAQIRSRSLQADALVADVRAAIAGGSAPPGIPVVVAGDLNAYDTDPRRHLRTLIEGDILDEARFGTDASLDPAGIPMVDLLPTHNGRGADTWTWRDDTQQFIPFALDRIIFSSSSLIAVHSFVLNTSIMTEDELAAAGLHAGDVALSPADRIFDHLPLVVDFRVIAALYDSDDRR